MDNQQGLEEINHALESQSVYSSVGIVERALNQMEEYDFFVVVFDISHNSPSILTTIPIVM